MRKETAKVLIRMALWTVPLVLIAGSVIGMVLLALIWSWPEI